MNIFYLDTDPKVAAKHHCDKHVVKMILESAQLLSSAHRVLDGTQAGKSWALPDWRETLLYKATHINHPCALWARESLANYLWLEELFMSLCHEYTRRYHRMHLCEDRFQDVFALQPPNNIKRAGFTSPPQCMPEEYHVLGDPVKAYRGYYNNEKVRFATWKFSQTPDWFAK